MTLRQRLLADLDRWSDRGGTTPGDEVVDFLVERRGEVGPHLRSDALAEALAAWWVRWLRRKSQFAQLDARTVADGYRRALAQVADVLAGSGFDFTDRGTHTLKGVPDSWQLFSIRRP